MPTKTPSKPRVPKKDAEPSTALAAPKEENPEETPEISRFVLSSSMGLEVVGDPTFEEWEVIVATYGHIYDKSAWWIGDAIAYGEAKFGEKYAQAIKITGRKLGTLKNIVSVCQRVQKSRRRDKLSFKHHSLIAGLHYQTGDELLAQAEREHWNTDDMEEEVKRRKALSDGVDPTEPTRKPGTTAAKVAASGKEPQLPEGEKPLIWNGHPLRTAGRLVYEADELLQPEEAERAAHFHKFSHKEALMNWLEEHNFIKGGDEPCAPSNPTASPVGSETASVESVKNTDQSQLSTTTSLPKSSASNGAAPNATESAPTPQIAPAPAPAAPPASPQPDGLVTSAGIITEASFLEMKAEMEKAIKERDDALQKNASLADSIKTTLTETAKQTPLQRAEEAILAFNAASEAVDWTALDKLTTLKWLERLLIRVDVVIDILQRKPPTPRK